LANTWISRVFDRSNTWISGLLLALNAPRSAERAARLGLVDGSGLLVAGTLLKSKIGHGSLSQEGLAVFYFRA
jgi:hypothetical protein